MADEQREREILAAKQQALDEERDRIAKEREMDL